MFLENFVCQLPMKQHWYLSALVSFSSVAKRRGKKAEKLEELKASNSSSEEILIITLTMWSHIKDNKADVASRQPQHETGGLAPNLRVVQHPHEDNPTPWFEPVQHTAAFRKSGSSLGRKKITSYSGVAVFLCAQINFLEMDHFVAVSSVDVQCQEATQGLMK